MSLKDNLLTIPKLQTACFYHKNSKSNKLLNMTTLKTMLCKMEAISTSMNPIGYMKTLFKFKNGTPRQPTVCAHARGSLTIDKSIFNNPEHSIEGLEDYSHIWILFVFHKNNNSYTKAKVRPPRLNGKKVGLFSSRSPYRPNNIGLSLARIESVAGATVYVSGIDILDGTPVLDIKPYIPQYDNPSHWVSRDIYDNDQNIQSGENVEVNEVERDDIKDRDVVNNASDDSKLFEKESSIQVAVTLTGKDKTAITNNTVKFEKRNETGIGQIDKCEDSAFTHKFPNTHNKLDEDEGSACYENQEVLEHSLISCRENPCKSLEHSLGTSDVDKGFESGKHADNSDLLNPMLLDGLNHVNMNATPKTAEWICNPNVKQLHVRFTPSAEKQLEMFSETCEEEVFRLQFLKSKAQAKEAIVSILHEDPRSTYRRKNCVDSLYYFTVDSLHVTCWFDDHIVEVVRIKPAALVEHCSSEYK